MSRPSGYIVPVQEQLTNVLNLGIGTFVYPAQSRLWHWYSNIICSMFVIDPDLGVGDTLDVSIETVDPSGMVIGLGSFTQVLGNSSSANLLQQVRVLQKTSSVSWYDRMQVRAIGAGATAAFDFKVNIQGSVQ